MSASVGIAIGTFGDERWKELAKNAIRSAQRTSADQIIHCHEESLSEARNSAAQALQTDYVIFLDADDFLDPNYVDALRSALRPGNVLYQPATLGLHPSGEYDPEANIIPDRGIFNSNFLVIGTACKRESFLDVGGFRDLRVLEDWELWLRMIVNGAKVVSVPDMIYIVSVNNNGRNSNKVLQSKIYNQIRKEYRSYREKYFDNYSLGA